MRTVLTATLFTVLAAAPLHAEDLKIGYIITQRLIAETEVGKAAAAELKEKMEDAQGGLEKKLEEIKDLEADLQRRAMVLSEEERKKAGEELERELLDAKRLKEDFQRSLRKTEAGVMAKVNEFLREVIQDYGEKHGYDLILDASTLLYVSDKPDLTEEVIKAANAAKRPGD